MTHRYIGTKEVVAWPAEKDGKPGYSVKYADGYTSWSPKEAFEEAYRTSEPDIQQALTFCDALHYLKLGKKVARSGWNGKGMWLVLAQNWAASLGSPIGTPNAAPFAMPDDWAGNLDFIAMYTADKKLVPWLASQTDILANDWAVL